VNKSKGKEEIIFSGRNGMKKGCQPLSALQLALILSYTVFAAFL
jgi:hypothetical protein